MVLTQEQQRQVEGFLPQANNIAKAAAGASWNRHTQDELKQIAAMGACEAVAKYDAAQCDTFPAYAQLIIAGRVLDWRRVEARHSGESLESDLKDEHPNTPRDGDAHRRYCGPRGRLAVAGEDGGQQRSTRLEGYAKPAELSPGEQLDTLLAIIQQRPNVPCIGLLIEHVYHGKTHEELAVDYGMTLDIARRRIERAERELDADCPHLQLTTDQRRGLFADLIERQDAGESYRTSRYNVRVNVGGVLRRVSVAQLRRIEAEGIENKWLAEQENQSCVA
jgi:DNA-directed RNA polymerase specialized sigma24 family protein